MDEYWPLEYNALHTNTLEYTGEFGGKEFVIHYTDGIKEGSGEIEITIFDDFIKGDSYWLEVFSGVSYNSAICSKSLECATLRLGEKKYHSISNNCEHFVRWYVTGKPGGSAKLFSTGTE